MSSSIDRPETIRAIASVIEKLSASAAWCRVKRCSGLEIR